MAKFLLLERGTDKGSEKLDPKKTVRATDDALRNYDDPLSKLLEFDVMADTLFIVSATADCAVYMENVLVIEVSVPTPGAFRLQRSAR